MKYKSFNAKKQKGFTLFEVALTSALLGIITMMLAPSMRAMQTARDAMHAQNQLVINTKISKAIQDYAANSPQTGTFNMGGTIPGTLPDPYTGGSGATKVVLGVIQPSAITAFATDNTHLAFYLQNRGLQAKEINGDGRTGDNVRVYQKVPDQTIDVPLYGRSGPSVTLVYDVGIVYATNCPRAMTCNTAATSSAPPNSPKLTSSNITTWAADSRMVSPVMFTNLDTQLAMKDLTVSRLNQVRTSLQNYYSVKGSYPRFDKWNSPNTVYLNPNTNDGCHEMWYALDDDAETDPLLEGKGVLSKIGLDRHEFGRTAWNATIEYCNDYDITGSGIATRAQKPDYAALRINRVLSYGDIPDSTTLSNNAKISF